MVAQFILASLVAVLDFGSIGRISSAFLGLSIGLVIVWAFCWFGRQRDAFRYALIQSLLFSLIGFTSPIVWVVIFIGAYFIVDTLKARFFDASSIVLAIVALAVTSLWFAAVIGIATRSFDIITVIFGICANCIAGVILYYSLGIRFKFLQRWAGRRL